MKKYYQEPAIELIKLQAEDIITTSGEDEGTKLPIQGFDVWGSDEP